METTRIIVGMFQTNCYLLKKEKHVLIIDPGSNVRKICEHINEDETVDAILLTHGHLDHIGAVDGIFRLFNCSVYVSENDSEMLKDAYLNCSGKNRIVVQSPVNFIEEGMHDIGEFKVEVFETPGHTRGSLVYRIENMLFTGDTLFRCSIGRTDLPSGSESDLRKSLRIFASMDPGLIVYPGHDDSSTIDFELQNNPFL